MPTTVQLNILTAGGILEPQAEWTTAAQAHVERAIAAQLRAKNLSVEKFEFVGENDPEFAEISELLNLNGAVGRAIRQHKLDTPLPSKASAFDWTLGSDATLIARRTGSEYGLFINITDSYSSAGRILVQVFAAALGVGVTGGEQLGFASLVDLRTGDIVWFNHLHSTMGGLREAEPASEAVEDLLTGLPEPRI